MAGILSIYTNMLGFFDYLLFSLLFPKFEIMNFVRSAEPFFLTISSNYEKATFSPSVVLPH